ncbi:MAG: FtsQ-type POTRA domain-containing protein, partial [Nitrospinota bacterium]
MRLPSEKRELFINGVKQVLKTTFMSFFTFTLILGGYYLYYQAMTSADFQISNFGIKGNSFLQKSKVIQLAKQGVLGQNIFQANIQRVSDRLKDNPWIETAEVSRKMPDSLQVKIKERIPFAKIEMTDGKTFLMDRKAFLIKEIESHEYRVLPAIQLNDDTYYEIGSSLQSEEIKNGIKFIEKIFSVENSDQVINFTSLTMEEGGRYILKTSSAPVRVSEESLKENLDKLRIASKII